MFRFTKKAFFSLSAVFVILGVFLSCENPFKPDMGEKVDIMPPVISVDSPVPGAFLKGTVRFQGTASAYRELVSVEVKIHNMAQGEEDKPLMDWTRENVIFEPSENIKEKSWHFDLDTLGIVLPGGQEGLEDGLLKIQFRAHDPNLNTPSIELVYIVKNRISDIRITAPNLNTESNPPRLITGTEVRGQITDRKGLKPGYPMIKIWPTMDYLAGEPDDDDVNWGWASLFLQGIDNPIGTPIGGSEGQGSYADRTQMPIVRVAQFIFKLDEFKIDPATRQIRYETNAIGEHQPLESGRQFSFKIKTSDSYSDEGTLFPRAPIEEDGEFEIFGYYPPAIDPVTHEEDPFDPDGPSILMLLISAEELPVIRIDNDDVREREQQEGIEILNTRPNHYIREEEPTSRKIAIGKDGIEDFRLQILARHSDFIDFAILEYVHESSGRRGFLKWDDRDADGGFGYLNDADDNERAKGGYRGRYKNPSSMGEGKLFTFTAWGDLLEHDPINPGYNKPIFTSSSEPYILEVTAYSYTGAFNQPPQRYVVYMDGEGPTVRILGVKGSTSAPATVTYNTTQDDARNDDPYTVNSNIQVTISRVDDSGIMVFNQYEDDDVAPLVLEPNGYPKVKWIIEDKDPDTAGSTLSFLNDYRAEPTKAGLEFFEKIADDYKSGWVRTPRSQAPGVGREDMMHNFKFNTRYQDGDGNNIWNKKELWLYIIAQDSVYNLGYILQKIYIDDDADMPDMGEPLSEFNSGDHKINGPEGLYVDVDTDRNNWSGNWSTEGRPRSNILEMGQGIALNFADDDGIVRDRSGILITITDLNIVPHIDRTLTANQLAAALPNGNPNENNSSMEWSGILDQRIMAAAFLDIDDPAELDSEDPRARLNDGFYQLTVKITDDVKAKVAIEDRPGGTRPGDIPQAVATETTDFFFAVYRNPPEFDEDAISPADTSLQNAKLEPIEGTVKSRLGVQKLWISFTPDIISTTTNERASPQVELVLEPVAGAQPDSDGFFVYEWAYDWNGSGVDFSRPVAGFASDRRRYSLEAYDSIGNAYILERSVQVDTKPPEVTIVEFNNNRSDNVVNGKVPFIVTASDENGLAEFDDNHAGVKWWVRHVTPANPNPVPAWDDDFDTGEDGAGGWFTFDDALPGGRFQAIFNSTFLKDEDTYALYVIAEDKAGNRNTPAALSFTVDQDSDYPTFFARTLFPPNGTTGESVRGVVGLAISGEAEDDDLFDPGKVSATAGAAENRYVQIRFPENNGGVWAFSSDLEAGWIPVPGSIDPAGVLNFRFDFDAHGGVSDSRFGGYFSFDGEKRYQLKITDEPDGPPPPPAVQTHFGKNPDGDTENDPGYIGEVFRIYPHVSPEGSGWYTFTLDISPPIISFNHYDPTPNNDKNQHPNYRSTRPTYRTLNDLIAELNGTVDEANLEFLSITYGTQQPLELLSGRPTTGTVQAWPPDDKKAEFRAYLAAFDSPLTPQGTQSVTLEAYDTAGNPVSIVWSFSKDTEGPQIIPTNITRAIRHAPSPAVAAFPNGSASGATQGQTWPSDWPYGTALPDGNTAYYWKDGDGTLPGWTTAWQNTIRDWPSEYAFLTPVNVITALDNDRTNTANLSVVFDNGDYDKPVIRGRFQDELSPVRIMNAAGEPQTTNFYYRIRSGTKSNGRDDPNWTPKAIEGVVGTQRPSAANWVINIGDIAGLIDGLNYLDIKMEDRAGNWSELYGLEFLLDRAAPHFGFEGVIHTAETAPQHFEANPAPTTWAELPTETERVFSSVYAAPLIGISAFELRGSIYEHNLRDVSITISQEGAAGYTRTAKYDLNKDESGNHDTAANGGNPDSDGNYRLTVKGTGPITDDHPNGEGPQYTWVLKILASDVTALRGPGPDYNNSRRHFVSVTATDKASRRISPVTWNFYLDSETPTVEYMNLVAGAESTVFGTGDVSLTGVVSDDTKVRDLWYSIAKWSYTDNRWFWYNTGTGEWSLTAQPPTGEWPSMLNPNPANPAYNQTNAQTSVNWNLTQEQLTASNLYPTDFFTNNSKHEGRYKIDLYAKDWSLGNGNPLDTRDNKTTGDNTLVGSLSRQFFIDIADPVITFDIETDNKQYFNNAYIDSTGFKLYVSDINTIARIEAEILNENGIVIDGLGREDITEVKNMLEYDLVANMGADKDNPLEVTVRPIMKVGGSSTGAYLDATTSPRAFTLRLYVFDGAGRQATINNTKQFILDNEKPKLDVTPEGGDDAVTGRVNIKGNADDNSSMLSRIAFYVPNKASGYAPPNASSTWLYNEGPGSPSALIQNGITLMELDEGTFTWDLRIPNTRNFLTADSANIDMYVQWSVTTGSTSLLYNGEKIPEGMDVGKLLVYILVVDEAGNELVKECTYWIYPEGDRPVVSVIRNPDMNAIEMERQFNGSIRISGQARDNERIRNVWFRVLDDNGFPYTNLSIPEWDETDWTKPGSLNPGQRAQTEDKIGSYREGDAPGDGWYMANRGGDTDSVASWWAMINTQGELESGDLGANRITIEVRAEDTTENESWINENDKWLSSTNPDRPGLLSLKREVTAFVVAGAPIFEDEYISLGASKDATFWGSINEMNIRGIASYRIVVKGENGIGAVRWTKTEWSPSMNGGIGGFRSTPGMSINVLDKDYLEKTGPGTYDYYLTGVPLTSPDIAMAVKAEPHPSYTQTGALVKNAYVYNPSGPNYNPNAFFYIWEPTTDPGALFIYDEDTGASVPLKPQDNKRGTIFQYASGTFDGEALEMVDDYFLWVVTVDVNTQKLVDYLDTLGYGDENVPGREGQVPGSVQYPIYLSASDISRSTPLTASRTSFLPIDHHAPTATYTLNRRPAGISVPVGGEAADDGPVSGVARVVLWFSRLVGESGSRTREYVSWHENEITKGNALFHPPIDEFLTSDHSVNSEDVDWAANLKGSVIPNQSWDNKQLKVPYIPGELNSANQFATGGDYAIVIDRNNPSVGSNHHGHNLPMGFSVGGSGMLWYVELNSLGLTSGPVTMHFVVFDQAGNARYYEEPLVIMNNAPLIDRIKLGTAISEKHDFSAITTRSVTTGILADGTPVFSSIILDQIRDEFEAQYPDSKYPNIEWDVSKGISDYISSSALNVDRVIDFNARNNLLALRIETTDAPAEGKSRQFRFEYVSGSTRLANAQLANVKAGRIYIIDDPGTVNWGGLGAEGQGPWSRGYAFMAAVDGKSINGPRVSGTGSAWELNSAYYGPDSTTPDTWIEKGSGSIPPELNLPDAVYPYSGPTPPSTPTKITEARSAEFSYANAAFGTNFGNSIIDFAGSNAWPPATSSNPPQDHSLFILKVFDGIEEDLFCDFALIRIRVNNNDVTRPFSQLYDLNPMTEGQTRRQTIQRSVSPMFIGEGPNNSNRTKGGLYNNDQFPSVVRLGHIEPRRMNGAGYGSAYTVNQHSLTSIQMGGVLDRERHSDTSPWANPVGFLGTDTVSGQVVLRGYVEDDQQIERVDLVIGGTTVTILERDPTGTEPHPGDAYDFIPPTTGLLRTATNANASGRVYYSDSIDLYRHRVEWAYIWDTEAIPSGVIVGSTNVGVLAYNRHSVSSATAKVSASVTAPGPAHATSGLLNYEIQNPGFPVGLNKYNSISMNLRPYITGFVRNKDLFRHNTRSLQGRYIFNRGEAVVVQGFNLGTSGQTVTILLPGELAVTTTAITNQQNAYDLPSNANSLPHRYRILTIPTTATTSAAAGSGTTDGTVMLRNGTGTSAIYAINSRIGNQNFGERPLLNADGTVLQQSMTGRHWVQPWNTERSGIDGSDLWEDFTAVHIWQSNDFRPDTAATVRPDQGAFPTRRPNWVVENPAMTIDPRDGTLWSSSNEGGGGYGQFGYNNGTMMITNNNVSWAGNPRSTVNNVLEFVDPIIMSDIYFSPGGTASNSPSASPWGVSSIIGRSATSQEWEHLGGIYAAGPGGATSGLSNGTGSSNSPYVTIAGNTIRHYLIEKTWYNASNRSPVTTSADRPGGNTDPSSTDQFENPHIVTHVSGTDEYIHVSYYDTKDHSIKYRMNTRGAPGTISASGETASTALGKNEDIRKWINLDGAWDAEDQNEGELIPESSTLNQANKGNDVADGNRFIREIYVSNGQYVTEGQPVYRLGAPTRNPADTASETIITARRDGSITLDYTTLFRPTVTGTFSNGTAGYRYLRQVHVQNYQWVNQGDLIYTFGQRAQGTTTNQTQVVANASGYITLVYLNAPMSGTNYSTQLGTGTNNVFTIGQTVTPTLQLANNNVALTTSGTAQARTLQAAYGSAIPTAGTAVNYTIASFNNGLGVPASASQQNYTLNQAIGSNQTINTSGTNQNNYARAIYYHPGDVVKQGDVIMEFGRAAEINTANIVYIRAPFDGTINRIWNNTANQGGNRNWTSAVNANVVTWTGTAGSRTFTNTRSGTTSYLLSITPTLQSNYVRYRNPNIANTRWVNQGEVLFRIGVAAENNTTASELVLTAPISGIVSNYYATFASTGTAPNRTFTTSAPATTLFTITPAGQNILREVHVSNNQFVREGDLIYTYGVAGETPTEYFPTHEVTAVRDGIITGLLSVSSVSGTTAPNRTFNTVTANNVNVYTITSPAYNFLRQTHVTNGSFVTAGQVIYTFGASGINASDPPPLPTTEIKAPFDGIITGLLPANFNATTGLYTNQVANNTNVFTLSGDFMYTIPDNNSRVYIISYADVGAPFQRIVNWNTRPVNRINAGFHNAIAVTSDGCPVVAYYDATNSRLKMAISNSQTPTTADDWRIIDEVVPRGIYQFGTGEYVSMKIDTRPGGGSQNRVHIAALNANIKKLVYISGIINPSDFTFTDRSVQVVDNVGDVGRWCTISIDVNGNPWIAYHDESYSGSKDGVKMAYRNNTAFTKTLNDMYGTLITGWETMHVPTDYSVENARTGMECFPTRNWPLTGTSPPTKFWSGAVSYLAPDYFRIAYYVK
ncbi:MAG: hypothetical protein FWG46_01380 [Treponema sp.]|nr:hypothetical protein [Treponema sp.]